MINPLGPVFLLSLALLFTGCKVQPPKPPLLQTLAILPFDNETNDLNADTLMQEMVYDAMKSTAYQVRSIDETNQHLEGKGIVDGGQLPALDPVKIAQDLGVQGLMYGYVESFGYVNIGFYYQRKVAVALSVVDGTTGEVLWENEGSMTNRFFAGNEDEAKKLFLEGLGDQAVDKVLKNPLEAEAKVATLKALASLPGFDTHAMRHWQPSAIRGKTPLQNKKIHKSKK